MSKYAELSDLNLNGYVCFCRDDVVVDGKSAHLYLPSKGDYRSGFSEVRGLLPELEILTKLNMTNTNKFYDQDGVEV